ncbi:peptidoglycan-associated lipoprotein Pal [Hahella sp. KA22]|uniref:peptidoglycan-associated lipoprotein Pal n=1 Tax=Hahella sp. KA22 TaxID=1628392 RepID=UPI000FDD6DAD|nr:peptidoglycan-associated lipoprotein Pal [Hahella sp. KA22]AZZ91201.1 peptidoglycan-associated lipoprotein Pal [Hahella sp. KA22]QAY54569.1 peptidoglycan-associated lipoprotein Pal [Hahella sp. KA22]
MNVLSIRNIFALVLVSFIAAGCTSTDTKPDETVGVVDQDGADAGGVGLGNGSGLSEEELAEQQRLAEQNAMTAEQDALREVRVFYFDFDKTIVKPESHMSLRAHAALLAANPAVKVVLNGYADERGTKEYNLALGERRAQAIERFLVVNGASDSQIETVSYGEEFPVDPSHNEAAWNKNRRVVIEYK